MNDGSLKLYRTAAEAYPAADTNAAKTHTASIFSASTGDLGLTTQIQKVGALIKTYRKEARDIVSYKRPVNRRSYSSAS